MFHLLVFYRFKLICGPLSSLVCFSFLFFQCAVISALCSVSFLTHSLPMLLIFHLVLFFSLYRWHLTMFRSSFWPVTFVCVIQQCVFLFPSLPFPIPSIPSLLEGVLHLLFGLGWSWQLECRYVYGHRLVADMQGVPILHIPTVRTSIEFMIVCAVPDTYSVVHLRHSSYICLLSSHFSVHFFVQDFGYFLAAGLCYGSIPQPLVYTVATCYHRFHQQYQSIVTAN